MTTYEAEEREDVKLLLTDAIPELAALMRDVEYVEPVEVMDLLDSHGLQIRSAAPVQDV